MATDAKTVLDAVLARIDDPETLGVRDRDSARTILDRLHEHLNFRLRLLTATATLTQTPRRTVYALGEIADDCQRVLNVAYQGRSISRQPWTSLGRVDGQWLRRVGPRPLMWCPFGLGTIIIYPAPRTFSAVDVFYARRPAVLTTEDTVLELRDDRLPLLRTLTEIVLHLRARNLTQATALLQALPSAFTAADLVSGQRNADV